MPSSANSKPANSSPRPTNSSAKPTMRPTSIRSSRKTSTAEQRSALRPYRPGGWCPQRHAVLQHRQCLLSDERHRPRHSQLPPCGAIHPRRPQPRTEPAHRPRSPPRHFRGGPERQGHAYPSLLALRHPAGDALDALRRPFSAVLGARRPSALPSEAVSQLGARPVRRNSILFLGSLAVEFTTQASQQAGVLRTAGHEPALGTCQSYEPLGSLAVEFTTQASQQEVPSSHRRSSPAGQSYEVQGSSTPAPSSSSSKLATSGTTSNCPTAGSAGFPPTAPPSSDSSVPSHIIVYNPTPS